MHRCSIIFVVDEQTGKYCIQRRSLNKDYQPGKMDISFGGVVRANEMRDMHEAAEREVREELGILGIDSRQLALNYAFKQRYEDAFTQCWAYVYYLKWPRFGQFQCGRQIQLRPQETEVDALFWWNEYEISHGLENGAIPKEGAPIWSKWLDY